ncbi:Serine/threonine-protein kinase wnk3 [Actinomortierella ambigua]|nr:Serine/threonine-protein kinase wnk3 [Actinomortierella ambigua]
MGSNVNQADTTGDSDDENLPVETDPSGRFQRCTESLGKGAYKHVYRAFDQEEGVEVAWNQLRIDGLSKKEAQKILSEIEILQSIRNDHIINFYASWSTKASNGGERIVFITELMSSGTLKQYLKKTLKGPLKPKVLKSWCRQILQGLLYLHTHDPPIIHRDLKCDNIFINGNNGQLKIGDLGLAVLRHKTHVSSVLGTPEFMAPELYEEKYNEKVDIYAFGMCVLEMVTKEYPYSECTNQAQIYRKVTQGIRPQSLEHVQCAEIADFIRRCLDHNEQTRPSAKELLDSDFLKPCAIVPACTGNITGPYPCRPLEGLDMERSSSVASSSRSSFADTTPATASTSTFVPVSSSLPVTPTPQTIPSLEQRPDQISIPTTEFTTTTTVDADNKTYHIRYNMVPNTPTSPLAQSTSAAGGATAAITVEATPEALEESTIATAPPAISDQSTAVASNPEPETLPSAPLPLEQGNDTTAVNVVDTTPTLHSHANNKTCSIQVIHHGDLNESQLSLKMICTCPVAGTRDLGGGNTNGGGAGAGTHEIKFPFDLNIDTAEEVVAEMIREQILSADDREEATRTILECIDSVLLGREQQRQLMQQQQFATARNSVVQQQQDKAKHHRHAKTHQRQLNVPPTGAMADYALEQFGTSPTESAYDHYSSIGSTASTMWNGPVSPSECSDQGYATQPPLPHSSLMPPPITESTFPPLHPQAAGPGGRRGSADILRETQAKLMPTSYSDVVQHPVKDQQHQYQHPLSPLMGNRSATVPVQRSQSEHIALPTAAAVSAAAATATASAAFKLDAHEPVIVRRRTTTASGATTTRGSLREIEMAAANMGVSTKSLQPRTRSAYGRDEDGDDVGYTSPYRHGVSSSSINYHRRSPSVEGGLLQLSSTVVLPSAVPIPVTGSAQTCITASHPQQQQQQQPYHPPPPPSSQSLSSSLPTQAFFPPSFTGRTTPDPLMTSSRPLSQIDVGPHNGSGVGPMFPTTTNSTEAPLSNGGGGGGLMFMPNGHGVGATTVSSHYVNGGGGTNPATTSPPASMSGGYHHFGNGTTTTGSHSSGPEMSEEDEELLDNDLKILREQQRREMELMRLQHLKQWEMMMKIKEQKGERPRRKSEVESPLQSLFANTPMSAGTPMMTGTPLMAGTPMMASTPTLPSYANGGSVTTPGGGAIPHPLVHTPATATSPKPIPMPVPVPVQVPMPVQAQHSAVLLDHSAPPRSATPANYV